MPCARSVRSSVLPAGTAILFSVNVGQLPLASAAEAASVKVQLPARLSSAIPDGTAAVKATPALLEKNKTEKEKRILDLKDGQPDPIFKMN